MIPLSLVNISQACNGRLVVGDNYQENLINNIVTDSRAFKKDQEKSADNYNAECAFLALKGPNFDGHRFAEQVVINGCKLLVVEEQCKNVDINKAAQIVVDDTRIALGKIAAYVKQQVAPKTVGITGSSGKTTVKEMVAAILSRLGKVLATHGNFNNDIGVPLTLLRLEHDHDFAVVEMGANHIGEIAYTTDLVKPDVAVINNIAAAHLEGFGDLCGVARAKGEIFAGLNEEGIALYNKDTKYASKWQWRLVDKNVRTFSCLNTADCYSSDTVLDDKGYASFQLHIPEGGCSINLSIPGKHNVCNAVAAASIALEFGATIEDISLGLAEMKPVQGRLNLHQLGKRVKLIDDTYNANLESVKAATQLLASYSGKQILILGDMGELGSEARSYHQEVGEFAKNLDIDVLLTLGVLSQSACDAFNIDSLNESDDDDSQHFNQRSALLEHLFLLLTDVSTSNQQDIAILVKGSRSAHMEHVVQETINWFELQTTNQRKEGIS